MRLDGSWWCFLYPFYFSVGIRIICWKLRIHICKNGLSGVVIDTKGKRHEELVLD